MKTVLITGGTGGLGLQLIEDLHKDYTIYSISRNKERILEAQNQFPDVSFLCGDITHADFLIQVADIIEKEQGTLDVLINNAGIIKSGSIETLSMEKWNNMLEVNVTATLQCVKILLPLMNHDERSAIVNVSSIASKITGGSFAYSACKAAVDMLTKSMAKELAKYKINVNSVNPGLVSTGFQVKNQMMGEESYQEFLKQQGESYPLGIGEPKDVSELIAFLISEKAKWMTGANYIIDGGRSVM